MSEYASSSRDELRYATSGDESRIAELFAEKLAPGTQDSSLVDSDSDDESIQHDSMSDEKVTISVEPSSPTRTQRTPEGVTQPFQSTKSEACKSPFRSFNTTSDLPDELELLLRRWHEKFGNSLPPCATNVPASNLYYHFKTHQPAYWMHRNGIKLKARMCKLPQYYHQQRPNSEAWQLAVVEGPGIGPHIVYYHGAGGKVGNLHSGGKGGTAFKIWLGADARDLKGFEPSPSILKYYDATKLAKMQPLVVSQEVLRSRGTLAPIQGQRKSSRKSEPAASLVVTLQSDAKEGARTRRKTDRWPVQRSADAMSHNPVKKAWDDSDNRFSNDVFRLRPKSKFFGNQFYDKEGNPLTAGARKRLAAQYAAGSNEVVRVNNPSSDNTQPSIGHTIASQFTTSRIFKPASTVQDRSLRAIIRNEHSTESSSNPAGPTKRSDRKRKRDEVSESTNQEETDDEDLLASFRSPLSPASIRPTSIQRQLAKSVTPISLLESTLSGPEAFIRTHTTFIFYSHHDKPEPKARSFEKCDSIQKLFNQALTKDVFVRPSPRAITASIDGGRAQVSLAEDDEDDFKDLMNALRQADCWKADANGHVTGTCTVEIRERA
jgi:hypothetical protein